MQFTLHATRQQTPHGASRLVQAMSAWLVKTRRAPSQHSRDARVYGHTTTAMHKLSTPRPHRSFALGECRSAPRIVACFESSKGEKKRNNWAYLQVLLLVLRQLCELRLGDPVPRLRRFNRSVNFELPLSLVQLE